LNQPPFQDQFVQLFNANFQRLNRFLDRLSGDPELAADLTQETFIKLYRRGSAPEKPEAWLITVGLNLFRNLKSSGSRRRRLLTNTRGEGAHSDPPLSAEQISEQAELRRHVRSAIERLPERERNLLLLRAEGYSYRDIAAALELNEASVGTLLARAQRAFRATYEAANAP
jgi:RNA polymerase sigma-70 factor (ECF subfamily)